MSAGGRFAAITCVTFDAGGTLLRPHPSVGAVYADAALHHGCRLDAPTVDRAFRAAFGRVSKNSSQLDPEARERDFWRQVVNATLTETGAPPMDGDAFFDDVWERFARGDHWRLLPGAVATLTTLRVRGYRLAVLSNWDSRLHRVLTETGLRPLVEAVLISSEVGAEKPDPAIFRAAERRLEVTPTQCLHIGDSPKHDRAGAHGAGWSALLVPHGDESPATGDGIAHLEDLLALLPGPAKAG